LEAAPNEATEGFDMKKKPGGEPPPLREQVLTALGLTKRPTHPRELASRLLDSDEDLPEFLELVERMVEEEHLEQLPGGRVKLGRRRDPVPTSSRAKADVWVGTFAQNPRGFGFVTQAGYDDVFIPPDAIFEAFHGDQVTVRVVGRSAKGLEGRIEGVVKRRDPRVTGVVVLRQKALWLEPDDARIRGPISLLVAEGAKDGDACVAEITRFPAFAGESPQGKIVSVLGRAGDPRTEVLKILANHQVLEGHAEATLENAAEVARLLKTPTLGNRRDLRHVPLPTIDPEDARDHDDAVWVERSGAGYRAYVAIADVSEFVQPGSALDEEARGRGCTIYLPDRAVPMLPSQLAADLCSLLPDVDRYCLAVIAELDAFGQVTEYEVVEGVMRSAAKLTYGGVARTLGFDPESPQSPAAEAMKAELETLAELAEKLRKRRFARGSLDLDLPEARVLLDEESGMPTEVKKRATRPGLKRAYALIEEMMLLANELVATWLTKRKVPAIYRVHLPPDPEKLERLSNVGEKLGLRLDVSTLQDPKELSALLVRLGDHPRKEVLSMLLLRSLKQAQYDINNLGHFGLASPCYLHFTSPIRRYPDLTVHRQVKNVLRGLPVDRSAGAIEQLREAATESSQRERAAMEVEREVLDLYRAVYMQRHVGESFPGKVTGVTGSGIYVQIDEPFCDVLVKFESLGPDRYEMSDDELSLVGSRSGDTVSLGDRITVTIEDVALLRRTVYARRELSETELSELRERATGTRPRAARTPLRSSREREGARGGAFALRGPGAGPKDGSAPKRSFKSAASKSAAGKTVGKAGGTSAASASAKGARRPSEKLLARGRTSPRSASEKATTRRTTRKPSRTKR
jgi:ribonuclease R